MFSKIVVKVGGKEYLIGCEDESKQHVYNIACELDKSVLTLKNRLLETTQGKDKLFSINNENLLLLQSITLLDENLSLKQELARLKTLNHPSASAGGFSNNLNNNEIEQELSLLEQEISFLKKQVFAK